MKDRESFRGKVVLVTGAASGLGRALAIAFASEGAGLVLVDVNEVGLEETARTIRGLGSECWTRRADVSSLPDMEALAVDVLREPGRVDVLVNNAGVGVGGELKDIPLCDLDWIVGVNLKGCVYSTRLFLPQMIERGAGHIVNVSSLSGLVLLPFHIPYTTTKYAITGFSNALWAETRRHGIGVTLVCPGAIKTKIMSNARVSIVTGSGKDPTERWAWILEDRGMDPAKVAEKVLAGVRANRFLVLTGFESYALYFLWRLAPGLSRRLVSIFTAFTTRGGS